MSALGLVTRGQLAGALALVTHGLVGGAADVELADVCECDTYVCVVSKLDRAQVVVPGPDSNTVRVSPIDTFVVSVCPEGCQ